MMLNIFLYSYLCLLYFSLLQCRRPSSIPGLGRSAGEGIAYPLRYADDTTLMAESEELMKVKEESEKVGFMFINSQPLSKIPDKNASVALLKNY